MELHWTKEQAEAFADLAAQEFANRQILLRGIGIPNLPAPPGAEYEDESTTPATRYRKTGDNPSDWTLVQIVKAATQDEVNNGVNNDRMVTPLTMNQRLNDFATQVLNVPPAEVNDQTGILQVVASSNSDNALFGIDLPINIQEQVISIVVNGYGINATLDDVTGLAVGQMISIRRGESHPFSISTSPTIKISGIMQFNDSNQWDNLTLQRISTIEWVEVARNEFS